MISKKKLLLMKKILKELYNIEAYGINGSYLEKYISKDLEFKPLNTLLSTNINPKNK